MKRCPQCEFLYEDDQSCCDMDGINLVFDHHPLTTSQALETRGALVRRTSRGAGGSAAASFVGIVFGVIILAIGNASFDRAVTLKDPAATAATAPESQSVKEQGAVRRPVKSLPSEDLPEATAIGDLSSKVNSGRTPAREHVARTAPVTRAPLNSTLALTSTGSRSKAVAPNAREYRAATPPASSSIRKREPAHARKDSKVVSIMKKTGRLLTKPFKL